MPKKKSSKLSKNTKKSAKKKAEPITKQSKTSSTKSQKAKGSNRTNLISVTPKNNKRSTEKKSKKDLNLQTPKSSMISKPKKQDSPTKISKQLFGGMPPENPSPSVQNIQKDEHHSDLVSHLANLHYQGKLDLTYLALDIREQRLWSTKILKEQRIKESEVTASACRQALDKFKTDWKATMLASNQIYRLKVVLVGDPDLDPAVRLEYPINSPSEAFAGGPEGSGTAYQEKSLGATVKSIPGPVEKEAIKQAARKETKVLEMQAPSSRGQRILGMRLLSLIRWLAANNWSIVEVNRLIETNRITIKQHTINLQHSAGRNHKTCYGPLPEIAAEQQKQLKEIRKTLFK